LRDGVPKKCLLPLLMRQYVLRREREGSKFFVPPYLIMGVQEIEFTSMGMN